MNNFAEKLNNFTFENHLELLHSSSDDKSWITLFKKGKKIMHYNYKYEALLNKVSEQFAKDNIFDLYVSQNTFFKPERTIENLRYLNALYIDLDYYKTNYRKESILYFLEKDYYGSKIPTPSMTIDSGRGLYLVWFIDPVPSMALNLWKAMQYYLYEQLKEFGADRKALDPTRVLRVVGSINSKTNRAVEVISTYGYRYGLKDLKAEFLPEVKEKPKKINKAKAKVTRFFNQYSLYKARIEDIETLCKLREYDLEGHREEILFLYRYYNCLELQDNELALEKTIELNSKFTNPLGMNEVTRDTLSAERYSKNEKYKYKNSTIIDVLDISIEEQKELKTLIDKQEKYARNNDKKKAKRRNENGLTKMEVEKLSKLRFIYKLQLKGFDNKAMAEEMQISIRQIQRLKKELETIDIKELVADEEENTKANYEYNEQDYYTIDEVAATLVVFDNEIDEPIENMHCIEGAT